MYGLNRLNSAKRLRALFTAAAVPSPTRLLRSAPFSHTSRRCAVDSPSPAAEDAGIDDLVYVGEVGKILGKDEIISQNKNAKRNYERKVLPPELLVPNVVKLTCESAAVGGTCDVYLVGTCHISPKSRRQTQAVVKFLEPQVVFLELCFDRAGFLRTPKVPTMEEMHDMWKKNENPLRILSKWFDAKLEHMYGGEFLVGYQEAMEYGGKVILGDRLYKITTERLWAKISLWELTKLAIPIFLCNAVLLSSAKALLKKANFFESLILETQFLHPTLVGTMVHERDQYMSAKLLKVARQHNSIVAVVGQGHLLGIKKNWKQPVDMKELLHTPTENGTFKKDEKRAAFAMISLSFLHLALCIQEMDLSSFII